MFAVLETTQAELVTDRFNSAGLNAGAPSRVAGLLSSWSQTQYRVGDINIASPSDGSPLLFPEIGYWRELGVLAGTVPPSISAPGLAVTLGPARPTARWSGVVEGSASGGRIAGPRAATDPPPIVRLRHWRSGHVVLSGPLRRNAGVLLGGSWRRNSTFDRDDPAPRSQQLASAFSQVVHTPSTGREVRVLGWLQRARTADARDVSLHLQSTYERRPMAGRAWKLYGGFTRRARTRADLHAASIDVDRLIDGPIPTLARDGDSTERRWSIGGFASPSPRRPSLQSGLEVEWVGLRATPFSGLIGERVDGQPARVWDYVSPGFESVRHATNVTGLVRDRVTLGPEILLDGWLRVESVRGRARGAATGVSWFSLLPGAHLRWRLGTPFDLAFVAGYRRSGNALLLASLAHGDPAAPSAEVRRWDGSLTPTGMLIARAGPGTGGDPAFSAIDPDLSRPHTDEFTIGLESRPRQTLRLAVAGIARRQTSLVNLVNVGVPISSSYSTFTVPDQNVDLIGPEDDHELVIFNRLPASFGRDRYLLTNPKHDAATMGAIVVSAQAESDRFFLVIGATASAAVGSAGHLGFRAVENDQDIAGELFANANAEPFARGRLFNDRAYTIKLTTVYRFPADVRLGVIARYQDGQPFARLVVVDGLNQGREAVRAFANGRSRFALTGTLDVRMQKGFPIGAARMDAILDGYNLLGMKKEVEERVVTGEGFRQSTALQPPRSFHMGVRISFE